jgi:hypothetical protein
LITYDVCVNENDIGDDIFSVIKMDLSVVNQYFQFKLMLNGMEQEIDPKAYSVFSYTDGSKGLCLRYQTNVDGCKDELDFTAGVVFLPFGKNIDSQDDQCAGDDPFVFQVDRGLESKYKLPPGNTVLTLPEEVYSRTKRLELLNLPSDGKRLETLYVKQTLTRCLEYLNEPSGSRNLEPLKCEDEKQEQFVININNKKIKKFTCGKLKSSGFLNNNKKNRCDSKLVEEREMKRMVKDVCIESCNNCPAVSL